METLNLANNKLEEISDLHETFPNLYVLNLSSNEILSSYQFKFLEFLPNLVNIDFSDNIFDCQE